MTTTTLAQYAFYVGVNLIFHRTLLFRIAPSGLPPLMYLHSVLAAVLLFFLQPTAGQPTPSLSIVCLIWPFQQALKWAAPSMDLDKHTYRLHMLIQQLLIYLCLSVATGGGSVSLWYAGGLLVCATIALLINLMRYGLRKRRIKCDAGILLVASLQSLAVVMLLTFAPGSPVVVFSYLQFWGSFSLLLVVQLTIGTHSFDLTTGDDFVDILIADLIRCICPFILMLLLLIFASKNALLCLWAVGLLPASWVTSITALIVLSLLSAVLAGYLTITAKRFVPYHSGPPRVLTPKFWISVAADCDVDTWERQIACRIASALGGRTDAPSKSSHLS